MLSRVFNDLDQAPYSGDAVYCESLARSQVAAGADHILAVTRNLSEPTWVVDV